MQRASPITLEAQRFFLQMGSPEFKVVKSVRQKQIVWEGYLQPGPLFKKRRVRISYSSKSRPVVTLPDEDFSARPLHTFEDGSLCLYHPWGIGAWRSWMPVTLLIPMISHWLWCYEMWLATGKWHGEEYPHPDTERKLDV